MIEIKLIPHHKNEFLTLMLDKIIFQIKKAKNPLCRNRTYAKW